MTKASLLTVAALSALSLFAAQGALAKTKAKAAPPAPSPVVRTYPTPTSFIASTAVVPDGYETIYVSGMLPAVAHPEAEKDSIASYGNSEEQAASVFEKLKAALEAQGSGLGDVVSMHVYMLGDPAMGGKMDFAGMMKSYLKYFGTPEQPNRPTRATVQVAGLAGPGFLLEIECIAVRPKKK